MGAHETSKPLEVTKRAFFLAWEAAGSPIGMGFLQDQPGASEEEVWQNVVGAGDYPGDPRGGAQSPYGDYVFGRMLKLRVTMGYQSVTVPDSEPRADYQAWCRVYPSYDALIKDAIAKVEE